MDARGVLQAVRRAAEDQSAGAGRCADGGEAREDRHRAGAGLRRHEARSRGRRRASPAAPKPAQDKISGVDEGGRRRRRRQARATAGCSPPRPGLYGTNYRQRAMITGIGLGANRPQDAVYPTSEGPDIVKKYSGAQQVRHALQQGRDAAGRRASGRSRCTTRATSSCRTRSTATR